jgi:hypothetical protein
MLGAFQQVCKIGFAPKQGFATIWKRFCQSYGSLALILLVSASIPYQQKHAESRMAEQDWLGINGSSRAVYEPAVAEPYAFTPPPPPPMPSARSSYELRPLTTGEILDRTFYLYRSNFWLFVALAAIAASVNTVAGLAQVLYIHFAGVGALATAGGKMNPAAMCWLSR